MSRNITIPEGAFLFKTWKVGGFTEIQVKGKTYRHYCLSKVRTRKSGILEEVKAYSAMTQKREKGWKGMLIADTSYYAKQLKPMDLVRQLQKMHARKKRKRRRRKKR